jgi:hypothetical protein
LNHLLIDDDILLRRADKRTNALGLGAQALNRRKNVGLLIGEGLPKLERPVPIVSHHVEHIWIASDRSNGWIPRLIVDLIGIIPRLKPCGGGGDVVGGGGGGKNLRQQRIGIERNGREQIIKLVRRQKGLGRRIRRGCDRRRRIGIVGVSRFVPPRADKERRNQQQRRENSHILRHRNLTDALKQPKTMEVAATILAIMEIGRKNLRSFVMANNALAIDETPARTHIIRTFHGRNKPCTSSWW